MWSLYRCPHCQGISTGKQWTEYTASHTDGQRSMMICPLCKTKVAAGKRIVIWEFWHSAS